MPSNRWDLTNRKRPRKFFYSNKVYSHMYVWAKMTFLWNHRDRIGSCGLYSHLQIKQFLFCCMDFQSNYTIPPWLIPDGSFMKEGAFRTGGRSPHVQFLPYSFPQGSLNPLNCFHFWPLFIWNFTRPEGCILPPWIKVCANARFTLFLLWLDAENRSDGGD